MDEMSMSMEDLAMGKRPDKKVEKKEAIGSVASKYLAKLNGLVDYTDAKSIKYYKKFNKTELRKIIKANDEVYEGFMLNKRMAREALDSMMTDMD